MGDEKYYDFLIEEYKTARERISKDIEELDRKEIFYITFIGAIYVFIFQYQVSDKTLLVLLNLLAVAISTYGIIRYDAHRSIIQLYENHIKSNIEVVLLDKKTTGLATYYDANKSSRLKYARYTLHYSMLVFTASMIFWVLTDHQSISQLILRAKS